MTVETFNLAKGTLDRIWVIGLSIRALSIVQTYVYDEDGKTLITPGEKIRKLNAERDRLQKQFDDL